MGPDEQHIDLHLMLDAYLDDRLEAARLYACIGSPYAMVDPDEQGPNWQKADKQARAALYRLLRAIGAYEKAFVSTLKETR